MRSGPLSAVFPRAGSIMGFHCVAFSKTGIYTVKRSIISAILLGGLMVSAHAADLSVDSVKDAIPDGPITWMGVTFYGAIDVGYAYANNGSYPSGAFYVGVGDTIFGSAFNHQNVSTLNNNALQNSNVGLKIEENIGYGFQAIGKLETQFNPISGELGDACASLLRFSGQSLNTVENNGDGSRCGQAFANAAYGGLSHPLYGTVTVGRQTSLVQDGMGTYDPLAGANAFSLISYTGTAGGGVGSTEAARWDNSVKYIFTYGPFHAAGMYTNGGQDTPMVNDGYGANAGVTYAGFAVDGFWTREDGAVSLSRLPLAGNGTFTTFNNTPLASGGVVNACNAALGNCPNYLLGTLTNNVAWDVMAKYTFDVPGFFGEPVASLKDKPCGGLKDEPCAPARAKVTLYGGYQYVDQGNPFENQSFYSGFTTIGGYRYVTSPTAKLAFGTDRTRETAWAGAGYEDGPWRITGAWYYWNQNSYLNASFQTCAVATAAVAATAKFRVGSNCSGDFNQGSFVIDYTFNRHVDIYGGVTFTDMNGGLVNGFLEDNTWAFATGVRVKW